MGCLRWVENKGFGFIGCDEMQDLYVHVSALMGPDQGGRLSPGDSIEFEVGMSPKTGKPVAVKVCRVSKMDMESDNAKKERLRGECTSWNTEKGFGFIHIDDGESVFVHSTDIQGADKLRRGDRVEFEVCVNFKHKKKKAVRVVQIEDDREPESVDADLDTNGAVSRKRKLESSEDDVKTSPTKKRKTGDGTAPIKSVEIDVPTIKLEKRDQAESIMEQMKTLTDRHKIHCHFEFKE